MECIHNMFAEQLLDCPRSVMLMADIIQTLGAPGEKALQKTRAAQAEVKRVSERRAELQEAMERELLRELQPLIKAAGELSDVWKTMWKLDNSKESREGAIKVLETFNAGPDAKTIPDDSITPSPSP